MLRQVKKIFELEAVTGILLLLATLLALVIANSSAFPIYQNIFAFNLPIGLTLRDFINDALMALFFFLIGLELKEEILVGELSTKSRAILPLIAACGGVIFPALIFYFCNFDQPQNLRGFAIPTATDIAFAYGVLCLFGKKISKSLKVFLISLAIFDDLVAILIIAFFYSQNIDFVFLTLVFVVLLGLAILNLKKSNNLVCYLLLGAMLWLMILKSGIHPTLAGIALAMFIPHKEDSLKKLIKKIAPAVNFLILPIFAFASSGVRIENFSTEVFTNPLVLGIILGLFFGKQIGVMLFSFISIKSGVAKLPSKSWLEFYGVTILTGIGFTMSFFIGSLAFLNDPLLLDGVKIAVLAASFLSAIFGILVISLTIKKTHEKPI